MNFYEVFSLKNNEWQGHEKKHFFTMLNFQVHA